MHESVQKLAQFTDITSVLVVGGLSSKVCSSFLTLKFDNLYFRLLSIEVEAIIPYFLHEVIF